MAIQVGTGTEDGASIASPGTIIEKMGAALLRLRVYEIKIRNANSTYNITDLYVGSFSLVSGTTFACRDATYCGLAPKAAVTTFAGKNLLFMPGDRIGAWFSAHASARYDIKNLTEGYGFYYTSSGGNLCVPGSSGVFTAFSTALSVRLIGLGNEEVLGGPRIAIARAVPIGTQYLP